MDGLSEGLETAEEVHLAGQGSHLEDIARIFLDIELVLDETVVLLLDLPQLLLHLEVLGHHDHLLVDPSSCASRVIELGDICLGAYDTYSSLQLGSTQLAHYDP